MTNETGMLTWSADTTVGRWRMGTLELMLAARSWWRGGVEAVVKKLEVSEQVVTYDA